jgi:hypothetical protein
MLEEMIREKIEDLVLRVEDFRGAQPTEPVNREATGWLTEAVNVIELAIPLENHAYRRRIVQLAENSKLRPFYRVWDVAAVLRSFSADCDAGLIVSFGNRVRAETFDDFLDYAETYHQEGEKQAAGVLAGVVFEDTIRRICRDQNITEKGQDLEQLINALARKTVITSLQSKQAKVAAHVRTKATHAQWDEYDLHGVAVTIQVTRTFLREHLDG